MRQAVDRRASEILKRLPAGPVIGAEIGVSRGLLSSRLLAREDLTLYMIDSYLPTEAQPQAYKDTGDVAAQLTGEQQARCKEEARQLTAFAGIRVVFLCEDSTRAAKRVAPKSLDFVFVDAAHDLASVTADIDAWHGKVKPGGLMSGHDYVAQSVNGVKRAVDSWVSAAGLSLDLGDNDTWFVRMP